MNEYQEGFRRDLLGTTINVSGKTWLKITGVYFLQIVIVLLFFGLIAFNSIKSIPGFSEDFFQNPTQLAGFLQGVLPSYMDVKIIFFVFVIAIGAIVFTSWHYNFSFQLTKKFIREGSVSMSEAFGKSFGSSFLRLMGAILLMYIIFAVGVLFSSLLSIVSPWAMGFGMIVFFILCYKFLLVIPAITLGNKSITDAINFSFKNISNAKCLKYFGVSILAVLLFGISGFFLGLITMLLSFIPLVGPLINFGSQIALGGFITALIVSNLSGMYYRVIDDIAIETETNLEDHLI